jgi:hypothetical protein
MNFAMRTPSAILAAALLLAGCAGLNPNRNFAPPAGQEPKPELTEPQAIARALRAGGYLIYARHGPTNRDELELESQTRANGRFNLEDCSTQRNLSAQGLAEMRAAGAAFRRLGLPVSRVLTSRYCRARQTAALFSERAEYADGLTSDGPVVKNPDRIVALRALLAAPPPAGSNTLLFAHQGIFYEATRLTVQEGWAVVLRPGDATRIVARIAPGDWAKLGAVP